VGPARAAGMQAGAISGGGAGVLLCAGV